MSGCIVGECSVCKDLVYETEWDGPIMVNFSEFVHEGECRRKFYAANHLKKLEEENERFKKRIIELEKQLRSGQLFLDI